MPGSVDGVPVVIYSALRLLVMGAVFAISYFLGAGVLIAALLAIVVGWLLSYLLLKPQADAAANWLIQRRQAQAEGRAPRFSAQISADEAAEDALIEEQVDREEQASPDEQADREESAEPDSLDESESQGQAEPEQDSDS